MKKFVLLSFLFCEAMSLFASPERVATDKSGFSAFDIFMMIILSIICIPILIGLINDERKQKKDKS